MKCVPVPLCIFLAVMGYEVDESIRESRAVLRHPVSDHIQAVFGLQLGSLAKALREGGHLARHRMIDIQLEDALAFRFYFL